jgi:hypothetical protein
MMTVLSNKTDQKVILSEAEGRVEESVGWVNAMEPRSGDICIARGVSPGFREAPKKD